MYLAAVPGELAMSKVLIERPSATPTPAQAAISDRAYITQTVHTPLHISFRPSTSIF